jgi:hypothetical protein
MVDRLFASYKASELVGTISVVAQGAAKLLGFKDRENVKFIQTAIPKNKGFAEGMNLAYRRGAAGGGHDAVLCINNDVEMPDLEWLGKLIEEGCLGSQVACPTTNYTGCREQEAKGYEDRAAFNVPSTPAVCWLLPPRACEILFRRQGDQNLFRPDLGLAWGEDTFASAVLCHEFNTKPFRVVPRAWIRHLGARTSSKVPTKKRMDSWGKARALIKKIYGQVRS